AQWIMAGGMMEWFDGARTVAGGQGDDARCHDGRSTSSDRATTTAGLMA
ncbi:MAG: hypothetical protein FD152_3939, partial [Xanthobacteraceae bacterium]